MPLSPRTALLKGPEKKGLEEIDWQAYDAENIRACLGQNIYDVDYVNLVVSVEDLVTDEAIGTLIHTDTMCTVFKKFRRVRIKSGNKFINKENTACSLRLLGHSQFQFLLGTDHICPRTMKTLIMQKWNVITVSNILKI